VKPQNRKVAVQTPKLAKIKVHGQRQGHVNRTLECGIENVEPLDGEVCKSKPRLTDVPGTTPGRIEVNGIHLRIHESLLRITQKECDPVSNAVHASIISCHG